MKRENALNTVGFCLLAACFLFALFQVFGHRRADRDDGKIVLRFSHWQLEGGLRDAFDQLARQYEKLHPNVRVEQLAIPERTYVQWTKTQLIGGTAPDIIQLGRDDIEVIARFFTPITEYVSKPNPYNAGTDLAATPWRETIVDNMGVHPSYRPELLENYGASASLFTVRMYYNRDLWRLILGDTPPPKTYDEFTAIFDRITDYNKRTGSQILAIAGSKANAPMLINMLVQSQTQRLVQEKISGPTLRVSPQEIGVRLLNGDWSLDDPRYTDALSIAREVALRMQPGFTQLGREDSAFYFVQGKALMITTGSWDSPSFRTQIDFDLGIFSVPTPSPSHPRYGQNTYGRASESEVSAGLSFGITRLTPHFDQALDFLQFLTSRPYNAEFSRLSGWLPSVVGVQPPESIADFLPFTEGYVPGFDLSVSSIGANTARVVESTSNRLYSPHGSVDEFRAALASELPRELEADIRRTLRLGELNNTRQDIALLAYLALQAHHPEQAIYPEKIDTLVEAQHGMESVNTWLAFELEQVRRKGR